MIQLTVDRILPLVDPRNIYISTNERYRGLVAEQLPGIPSANVLCEPVGRNTAPGIALAAAHLVKRHGDAMMVILPSDQLIRSETLFIELLRNACTLAGKNRNLVTVGIVPTYPATSYGYIRFDRKAARQRTSSAYHVDRFVEKPDSERAKSFLAEGNHLWNSGIFIWKASTLLANVQKHLPGIHAGIERIGPSIGTADYDRVLAEEFSAFPSVSIDVGVLEKAEDLYVLPSTFWWDDVGSWTAMGRINPTDEEGNTIAGDVVAIDMRNSIIQGAGRLIAVVGAEDLIVVDSEDTLLICNRNREQDLRQVLAKLREAGREGFV